MYYGFYLLAIALVLMVGQLAFALYQVASLFLSWTRTARTAIGTVWSWCSLRGWWSAGSWLVELSIDKFRILPRWRDVSQSHSTWIAQSTRSIWVRAQRCFSTRPNRTRVQIPLCAYRRKGPSSGADRAGAIHWGNGAALPRRSVQCEGQHATVMDAVQYWPSQKNKISALTCLRECPNEDSTEASKGTKKETRMVADRRLQTGCNRREVANQPSAN